VTITSLSTAPAPPLLEVSGLGVEFQTRGGTARVPDEERARLLQRTTAWKEDARLKPVRALYSAVEKGLGALRLADNLVLVLRRK